MNCPLQSSFQSKGSFKGFSTLKNYFSRFYLTGGEKFTDTLYNKIIIKKITIIIITIAVVVIVIFLLSYTLVCRELGLGG